jgi:3-oxoacyl-[acyl-carrier-protein] synthase-3
MSASAYGMRLEGLAAHVPEDTWSNSRVAARLRLERMRLREHRLARGEAPLTPDESKLFQTSDRWVRRFVGFSERRFCREGEGTIDLATRAGRMLLERTGRDPSGIDAVMLASVTPSYLHSPPDAALLQHALGIPAWRGPVPNDVKGADVSLACCSWVTTLMLVYGLVRSGLARCVLLVGADRMSATINWRDRSFATVLGDAGTAMLCTAVPESEDWFAPERFWGWLDGSRSDAITTPAGGSRRPLAATDAVDAGEHLLRMDGAEVRRVLVPFMGGEAAEASLAKAGWSLADLDCVALHEANPTLNDSIVHQWRERGFRGRVLSGGGRFGNTTSASIPLALALNAGELLAGRRLGMFGFGGGLSASVAFAHLRQSLPAWTNLG